MNTKHNEDAVERLGQVWCSLTHDSPMWPIHGHYECRVCGRQYRVPWAGTESMQATQVHESPIAYSRAA
jgi:hypothetical protein